LSASNCFEVFTVYFSDVKVTKLNLNSFVLSFKIATVSVTNFCLFLVSLAPNLLLANSSTLIFKFFIYVFLTVHLIIVFFNNQLDAQFFFLYLFIPVLYIFRAT